MSQRRTFEPIPKPVRIKNPNAISAARKKYCELCGVPVHPEQIHVHHIKSRGSGGHDQADNLISLCWRCHLKVHEGRIGRARLFSCVQGREPLGPKLMGL